MVIVVDCKNADSNLIAFAMSPCMFYKLTIRTTSELHILLNYNQNNGNAAQL
jgi:hypothetical protein